VHSLNEVMWIWCTVVQFFIFWGGGGGHLSLDSIQLRTTPNAITFVCSLYLT
jgi:hypothetical protein